MKVFINGIGIVGGFGCGISSLEKAVKEQNSHDPRDGSFGLNPTASCMAKADTALLSRFVPSKALRRVDHYSRMAVLAGCLALADAGCDAGGTGRLPGPMGVVVATGMGPTAHACDSISPDSGGLNLSPIQFSNSVHNAAAGYISMLLKIRGPNLSINQYDMSVPLAFRTAIDWLEEGRAGSVLVGGIDSCPDGICDAAPGFLSRNDGNARMRQAIAGEGSAFFVLALSERIESRYPRIRDIWTGKCRKDSLPWSNTLVLHNGSGEESRIVGPACQQAVFSPVYGTFPSGMAMDVAIAALLLRKNQVISDLLPDMDLGADFLKNPRICCIKKGVSGDCARIEMEQKPA